MVKVRDESEVFRDLEALCVSPGYVHALAYLCFRNNVIMYGDVLTADDLAHQYGYDRLIRTELATLIGLLARQPVDASMPTPDTVETYLEQTYKLLAELHDVMKSVWFAGFEFSKVGTDIPDPFATAEGMREPIFYGAESAYSFQYIELAAERYAADDQWLEANRGFSIGDAVVIANGLLKVQGNRQKKTLENLKSLEAEKWDFLPAFSFSVDELVEETGVEKPRVEAFLASFALSPQSQNSTFSALNEFNETNAAPIIDLRSGEYLLLQNFSLVASLYESPLFWMRQDKDYSSMAASNRGRFTEAFVEQCLRRVFPKQCVIANVNLINADKSVFGEIDVLVLYGDRAIVVQAKSKTLTIEARKGNDLQLKDDFKKAVQDSYDQASSCSEGLLDPEIRLVDVDGNEIPKPESLRAVIPVCAVSDHYPALALQARKFLDFDVTDNILSPLVTDVFAMDVMTEMLGSPLHFLHYLHLRARFGEKFMAGNELTLLGYHLKSNLWGDDKFEMMMVEDDVAAELDVAMLCRRTGTPGEKTPKGILTWHRNTPFGRLLSQIEAHIDPSTTDLGIWLLSLDQGTATQLGKGIEKLSQQSVQDRQCHDLTIGTGAPESGLTVHCSFAPDEEAVSKLLRHADLRKYSQKADSWYALLLHPDDLSIRWGAKTDAKWKHDALMDEMVSRMPATIDKKALASFVTQGGEAGAERSRKVGRNAPCPCGSGKKYKRCCLNG